MKRSQKQDDWTDPVGVGEDEIVNWMAGAGLCVGLIALCAVIFHLLGIFKILGWE